MFRRQKPGNIGKIDGDDRFKENENADAGSIIMFKYLSMMKIMLKYLSMMVTMIMMIRYLSPSGEFPRLVSVIRILGGDIAR